MGEKLLMWGVNLIDKLQKGFGTHHSENFAFWSTVSDPYSMSMFFFPLLFNLNRHIGIKLIWVAVITQWLNAVVKWTYHGQRPYWWTQEHGGPLLQHFPGTCETSPGSPSGHMMISVAVGYCMLSEIGDRVNANKFTRDIMALFLAFAVFMVGLSRMYLAAHFPHQVIFGAIAGLIIGRTLLCMNAYRLEVRHYVLMTALIIVSGSLMFFGLRMCGVDPLWTVHKAEEYCYNETFVRYKHNVWASFIRCASIILGVGFGLLVTSHKSEWDADRTPTWLRIVGAIMSVILAELSFHHIRVDFKDQKTFYSIIAAKAFGIPLAIILITEGCKRLGAYLDPPCPAPRVVRCR